MLSRLLVVSMTTRSDVYQLLVGARIRLFSDLNGYAPCGARGTPATPVDRFDEYACMVMCVSCMHSELTLARI